MAARTIDSSFNPVVEGLTGRRSYRLLHRAGTRPGTGPPEAAKRNDGMANDSGLPTGRTRRILESLADALGCSTDSFFEANATEEQVLTEELLALWSAIPRSADRRRILDFARAVKEGAAPE
jgi:hypothetical protein